MTVSPTSTPLHRTVADLQADVESTFVLLDLARAGDGRALDRLFTRYITPLRRFAHGRLPWSARDLLDTNDLVQETLLETFKRIEDFQPQREGALLAYLPQERLPTMDRTRPWRRPPRPSTRPSAARPRSATRRRSNA